MTGIFGSMTHRLQSITHTAYKRVARYLNTLFSAPYLFNVNSSRLKNVKF